MRLFNITCLLCISVCFVCGCKVDVRQSVEVLRSKEQESVFIPCSLNTSCVHAEPEVSWFVFHTDTHYQIEVRSQSLKYRLENQRLAISSLSIKDCGVYYCAVALRGAAHTGAQMIGRGTVLKVTERGLNIRQTLLLTLLVLLVVYSLLVLGIIIYIQTRQIRSAFNGRWSRSESQPDASRQERFSGVLQELYKRNLTGDNIQTNCKVAQEKTTAHQTQNRNEDIYQNLDE